MALLKEYDSFLHSEFVISRPMDHNDEKSPKSERQGLLAVFQTYMVLGQFHKVPCLPIREWLNPALAMFTTPDPLAFNTPDVSPYTFCAGDPVNYSDPTGEVIIFINGFHWGDGGKSEYWEGLDKRIMHSFGDYKCLYFDGSFGGYKNFPKNLSHHYRFKHGFELGYKMAWIIRESLSPDETIKYGETSGVLKASGSGVVNIASAGLSQRALKS